MKTGFFGGIVAYYSTFLVSLHVVPLMSEYSSQICSVVAGVISSLLIWCFNTLINRKKSRRSQGVHRSN
jgi:hypothetical protein